MTLGKLLRPVWSCSNLPERFQHTRSTRTIHLGLSLIEPTISTLTKRTSLLSMIHKRVFSMDTDIFLWVIETSKVQCAPTICRTRASFSTSSNVQSRASESTRRAVVVHRLSSSVVRFLISRDNRSLTTEMTKYTT